MNYHPDAAAEQEREQMDIQAGYRRFARRALDTSRTCMEEPGEGQRNGEHTAEHTTPSSTAGSVTFDRQPCSCPAPGR